MHHVSEHSPTTHDSPSSIWRFPLPPLLPATEPSNAFGLAQQPAYSTFFHDATAQTDPTDHSFLHRGSLGSMRTTSSMASQAEGPLTTSQPLRCRVSLDVVRDTSNRTPELGHSRNTSGPTPSPHTPVVPAQRFAARIVSHISPSPGSFQSTRSPSPGRRKAVPFYTIPLATDPIRESVNPLDPTEADLALRSAPGVIGLGEGWAGGPQGQKTRRVFWRRRRMEDNHADDPLTLWAVDPGAKKPGVLQDVWNRSRQFFASTVNVRSEGQATQSRGGRGFLSRSGVDLTTQRPGPGPGPNIANANADVKRRVHLFSRSEVLLAPRRPVSADIIFVSTRSKSNDQVERRMQHKEELYSRRFAKSDSLLAVPKRGSSLAATHVREILSRHNASSTVLPSTSWDDTPPPANLVLHLGSGEYYIPPRIPLPSASISPRIPLTSQWPKVHFPDPGSSRALRRVSTFGVHDTVPELRVDTGPTTNDALPRSVQGLDSIAAMLNSDARPLSQASLQSIRSWSQEVLRVSRSDLHLPTEEDVGETKPKPTPVWRRIPTVWSLRSKSGPEKVESLDGVRVGERPTTRLSRFSQLAFGRSQVSLVATHVPPTSTSSPSVDALASASSSSLNLKAAPSERPKARRSSIDWRKRLSKLTETSEPDDTASDEGAERERRPSFIDLLRRSSSRARVSREVPGTLIPKNNSETALARPAPSRESDTSSPRQRFILRSRPDRLTVHHSISSPALSYTPLQLRALGEEFSAEKILAVSRQTEVASPRLVFSTPSIPSLSTRPLPQITEDAEQPSMDGVESEQDSSKGSKSSIEKLVTPNRSNVYSRPSRATTASTLTPLFPLGHPLQSPRSSIVKPDQHAPSGTASSEEKNDILGDLPSALNTPGLKSTPRLGTAVFGRRGSWTREASGVSSDMVEDAGEFSLYNSLG